MTGLTTALNRAPSIKVPRGPSLDIDVEGRADIRACWDALGAQDGEVLTLKHLTGAADAVIGPNNYSHAQLKRALLQISPGPVGWEEFRTFMLGACYGTLPITAEQVIKTVSPGSTYSHGNKSSISSPKPAQQPGSLIMVTDTWRLVDLLHANKRQFLIKNVCTLTGGQGLNARKWYEDAALDEAADRQRQTLATATLSRALSVRKSIDSPHIGSLMGSTSGNLKVNLPQVLVGSGSLLSGAGAVASPTGRSPMYGRRRASMYSSGGVIPDTLAEDMLKLKTGSFETGIPASPAVLASPAKQVRGSDGHLLKPAEVTPLPSMFGGPFGGPSALLGKPPNETNKRESTSSSTELLSHRGSTETAKTLAGQGPAHLGNPRASIKRQASSKLLMGVHESLAAAGIATDQSVSNPAEADKDGYTLGKRRSALPNPVPAAAAAKPAAAPAVVHAAESSKALFAWIQKSSDYTQSSQSGGARE